VGARAEIVVYWRPGCGFCAALFRRLDALAVPYRRVNIWEDPDAAALVRGYAGGNETVPTVLVGTVSLVNPGIERLLGVAASEVPDAVPAGWQPRQPNRLARWVLARLAGGDDRPSV
jgi:glutaredoxin